MTAGTEPDARPLTIQGGADDAAMWFDLGVKHNEAERPAAAEAAFKIALEIDPDSAEAHLGLGLALMAQRRFAEASPPWTGRADPQARRTLGGCAMPSAAIWRASSRSAPQPSTRPLATSRSAPTLRLYKREPG